MLTALAWLFLAATALSAVAAIRATFAQHGKVALANLIALRDCAEVREFRVSIVGGRKPALAGHPGIRRVPHRAQAARSGLRAAAQPRRAAA